MKTEFVKKENSKKILDKADKRYSAGVKQDSEKRSRTGKRYGIFRYNETGELVGFVTSSLYNDWSNERVSLLSKASMLYFTTKGYPLVGDCSYNDIFVVKISSLTTEDKYGIHFDKDVSTITDSYSKGIIKFTKVKGKR